MSGIWDKSTSAWQMPDSASKAEGTAQAANSASKKESAEPTFEIDFSGTARTSPEENNATAANFQTAAEDKTLEYFDLGIAADTIPSLEVGQPGQFVTQQFDYGSNFARENASDDSQASSDAIVMVDEPLPESLSGGAGLQDLFVAEVLRNAQQGSLSEGTEQPTMIAGITAVQSSPTPLAENDKTQLANLSLDEPDDKTQITSETLAIQLNSGDDAGTVQTSDRTVSALPLAGSPESGKRTESDSLELGSPFEIDRSTEAASPLSSQAASDSAKESGISVQTESNIKVEQGQKSKSGSGTKNGNRSGKDKQKQNAGSKKTAGGQNQKSKQTSKAGSEANNNQAARSSVAASVSPLPVAVRGLSKEVRLLIGVFVLALLVVSAAIFKQLTRRQSSQLNAAEIAKISKQTEGDTKKQSHQTKKSSVAKAGEAKKMQAVPAKTPVAAKTPVVKTQDSDDEDAADESDEGDVLELTHVLTRPVSRYSESNQSLLPLIELNLALERVQPRRVLALLRGLPPTFSGTDLVQKTALREVTARYYMQVGAYQKALILFRQSCSDPVKTSEVEVCLHAARSFAVTGSVEEAKEVLTSLSVRLIGQNSQWREWLKLIELSLSLSRSGPSADSFIHFADEFIDKGPFLTTEWSIQLSALFARSFMAAPEKVRSAFLNAMTNQRRKMIELRLAPEKYGQDIGSYMFPAFVNIMLRHYELQQLNLGGDEPDTDSDLGLTSWVFNTIAQAKPNEPRETRARLAPLFAERGFTSLARLIEGQLAAQAGDYIGAHSMIIEQIGPTINQDALTSGGKIVQLQTRQIIDATQRLKNMPFLFVEWLFLGIKVATGLNDKESIKTYLVALEDARRRFPELGQELQFWFMYSRGHRVLGQVRGVEFALANASRLGTTKNDLGFIGADKVWVMMKKGQQKEAKQLMRQLLREIPHHARLLELAAEFSGPWGEEPSTYLRLEAEIPQKFQNRGRDSVLLSFFTMTKLLDYF